MKFHYWSKLNPLILLHLPCLFVNDFRRLCRTNEQMLPKYAFSWFLLNGSFLWNLFHLDIWFYGKSTEQNRDFLLIICQKPFFTFEQDTFLENDYLYTIAFVQISYLFYQMYGKVFPNKESLFLIDIVNNIRSIVFVIFRKLLLK